MGPLLWLCPPCADTGQSQDRNVSAPTCCSTGGFLPSYTRRPHLCPPNTVPTAVGWHWGQQPRTLSCCHHGIGDSSHSLSPEVREQDTTAGAWLLSTACCPEPAPQGDSRDCPQPPSPPGAELISLPPLLASLPGKAPGRQPSAGNVLQSREPGRFRGYPISFLTLCITLQEDADLALLLLAEVALPETWIPPCSPSCTLPRAPGPGDTAQPLVPLPCKPLQLPQVSQDAQVTKSGYESHLPARSSPQPNQPAGGRGTRAVLQPPAAPTSRPANATGESTLRFREGSFLHQRRAACKPNPGTRTHVQRSFLPP